MNNNENFLNNTFKAFVESAPVLCLAADKNYITYYVNPFYKDIHNISLADARGKHIKDIIGDEGFYDNLPYYKEALEGNVVVRIGKFTKVNGELHHYKATYSPIYDNEDEVIGLAGVVLDITSEIEIKNRIEQVECLNQQLLDSKEELGRLAVTDPLTGLYNRSGLNQRFIAEVERAERYNNTFGIIVIDIDDFKGVNDNYGHEAGDKVLEEFSNILKMNTRKVDIVGRWGGEEFLIIVPEADINAIKRLSQKLRVEIARYCFSNVKNRTASLGGTLYNKNESPQEAIKRADEALYKAKRSGKNRVEIETKNNL